MYAGMVILKDFVPMDEYELFLKLVCAVTICSTKTYAPYLPLARELFIEYINGYIDIYGLDSVTSNIHNLSHVVDDVEYLGDLSTISAYKFENSLHLIKLLLKQCNRPLEQLVRRLNERSLQEFSSCNKTFIPQLTRQFVNDNEIRFGQIEYEINIALRNNVKDKWVLLDNNDILCFEFAIKKDNEYFIHGKKLNVTEIFFTKPFNSKYLNICSSCGNRSTLVHSVPIKMIKAKLFCIPCGEKFVFIPLIHTLK